MSETIKALTIHEPWATAIKIEAKAFETRSWATNYRGRLAIHAGKRWTPQHAHALEKLKNANAKLRAYQPQDFHLGCVLCVCQLIHCYEITRSFKESILDREQLFGDWTLGRYAWRLQVVYVFDQPIPAQGQQGLWEWALPESLGGVNLSPPSNWMKTLGFEWEDDSR